MTSRFTHTHMHKYSRVLVSVVCAAVSVKHKDPLKKSRSTKVTTAACPLRLQITPSRSLIRVLCENHALLIFLSVKYL